MVLHEHHEVSWFRMKIHEASWFRGGKRWIETVDQETNHVYYVCPSTGESRITLPPPDHDQTRV